MAWRTYIDSFVGETRWNSGTFFFSIGEKGWEFFYRWHRDVTAIVAGKKGLDKRYIVSQGPEYASDMALQFATQIAVLTRDLTLPFKSRKNNAEAIVGDSCDDDVYLAQLKV